MTRILLTGAHGALGWYIKQYLLQGNQNGEHEIACLSRRDIDEPGIHNYCCDFLDKDAVNAVIANFKPEKTLLIAWETTHGSYWQDPNNIEWAEATIHFAEQFAKNAGSFLSFAGTCAEYQWSEEMMVEEVSTEKTHTLYGQQKLRVTHHLLDMHKQGRLVNNCCRLFFPYSERENKNRITSLVIQSILNDKPIHLRSGDVYRDICHTRHIAQAMCEMSFAEAGGLFNMSASEPIHLGKFLKQIGEHLGKAHLITWDDWADVKTSGSEPRYLFGSNKKIAPFLDVSDDQTQDIQLFADASLRRFTKSN